MERDFFLVHLRGEYIECWTRCRVTKNAKIDRKKGEEIVISRAARISAAKTPIISILVVIVTTERDDLVVLK